MALTLGVLLTIPSAVLYILVSVSFGYYLDRQSRIPKPVFMIGAQVVMIGRSRVESCADDRRLYRHDRLHQQARIVCVDNSELVHSHHCQNNHCPRSSLSELTPAQAHT